MSMKVIRSQLKRFTNKSKTHLVLRGLYKYPTFGPKMPQGEKQRTLEQIPSKRQAKEKQYKTCSDHWMKILTGLDSIQVDESETLARAKRKSIVNSTNADGDNEISDKKYNFDYLKLSKIIAKESVYGNVKTPNGGVVGKDKTMNKVKRLQHESKVSTLLCLIILRDHCCRSY